MRGGMTPNGGAAAGAGGGSPVKMIINDQGKKPTKKSRGRNSNGNNSNSNNIEWLKAYNPPASAAAAGGAAAGAGGGSPTNNELEKVIRGLNEYEMEYIEPIADRIAREYPNANNATRAHLIEVYTHYGYNKTPSGKLPRLKRTRNINPEPAAKPAEINGNRRFSSSSVAKPRKARKRKPTNNGSK